MAASSSSTFLVWKNKKKRTKPEFTTIEREVATALLLLDQGPPKITKVLTASDVGGNDRLMLSTRLVEDQFLSAMDRAMVLDCASPAGREFQVLDAKDGSSHSLILKQRRSNPSFVLVGQWVKNFVNRKGLEEGDTVQLTFDGTRIIFELLSKKN